MPETDLHRFWQCPANKHIEGCETSENLAWLAVRDHGKQDCLWLRGLLPSGMVADTTPPDAEEEWALGCDDAGERFLGTRDNPILGGGDGSGGVHTSDARLRRAGWATAILNGARDQTLRWGAFGSLGGLSAFAPFTRIPEGANSNQVLPSLLDFFLQEGDLIEDSWFDWGPGCADHALIAARLDMTFKSSRQMCGKWHCQSWDNALHWFGEYGECIASCKDVDRCNRFFLNAQDVLQDQRTCAQRRADRIPESIRDTYAQIAASTLESERMSLRDTARQLLREHRKAVRDDQARYIVKTGRVFAPSKKLHPIEGIASVQGHIVRDRAESDRLLYDHFPQSGVHVDLSCLLKYWISLPKQRVLHLLFPGV